MGLFRRIFGLNSATQDEEGPQISVNTFTMNEELALKQSAVFACIKLLTETVAGLPINVFDVDSKGSKSISKDNLHYLLHTQPNARMSSLEFKETLMLNLALHGNSYTLIQRDSKGNPISLYPLSTPQMEVSLINDRLIYNYSKGSNIIEFKQEDILHIKLFGNGITGLSPLSYAKSSISYGKHQSDYAENFFKRGGKPSGILKLQDKNLSHEAMSKLRKVYNSSSENGINHNQFIVLDKEVDYTPIQTSPKDMELLEGRHFSIQDVCRFFGVPSILINEATNSTTLGSSTEQMIDSFYKLTIKPYLTRIETALTTQLLSPVDKRTGNKVVEINFQSLLKASPTERATFYKEMSQIGALNINDIRRLENLEVYENGGDIPLVPLNLIPLDKLQEYHLNKNGTNK